MNKVLTVKEPDVLLRDSLPKEGGEIMEKKDAGMLMALTAGLLISTGFPDPLSSLHDTPNPKSKVGDNIAITGGPARLYKTAHRKEKEPPPKEVPEGTVLHVMREVNDALYVRTTTEPELRGWVRF